ncbi:hypothetical protein HB364_19850 [Pseudoflavitalea sp. X16]|uniref:hypothetical protein n=1 Tax=Paraflavitalea devenefica TaxID=2716334 RepID=UPI0014233574|nr:hypothetical protein [Paraflavitalea devenefica]NII27354.1 hypothetical protein [Paraflavitalea devenefica]
MHRHSFLIDKITNSIEDAQTGKSYKTEVVPVELTDFKTVLKKNGWRFNWRKEHKHAERQLYKILVEGDVNIQGLISLQPVENYIELHLIETAPHNYGKSKKYVGVPGNLVAFACKMSFDTGFEGFVGFRAKTQLIQHYVDTLGAELIFKDRMCISGISAKKLVNSYYKNYISG